MHTKRRGEVTKSSGRHRHLPLKPRTFLLLVILREGPRHGFALMQELEARSGGQLRIDAGLLYRTIASLRTAGLIRRCATAPEGDPRRKYYVLTELGESTVDAEARRQAEVLQSLAQSATATEGR